MSYWLGKTTSMTRSKGWWVEVAGSKPLIVYSHRRITRADAVEYIRRLHPNVRVVSCEAYVRPPQTVWSGRNAYRDANPKWWERLYGRE